MATKNMGTLPTNCNQSAAPDTYMSRRSTRSKSPFKDQQISLPALKESKNPPSTAPYKTSFYWPPSADLCPSNKPLQPQLPPSSNASTGNISPDDPLDSSFGAMPLATAPQSVTHRLLACAKQSRDQSVLQGGYRRSSCRSRPSSNESIKSCDTFAGFQHGAMLHRSEGDTLQQPAAKRAAHTVQTARCPAPRSTTRPLAQLQQDSTDNIAQQAQHAQHARLPVSTPNAVKRTLPPTTDTERTPCKRATVKRPSSEDSTRPQHARSRSLSAPQRRHSWDLNGKLPLPPCRSTESDQSSTPERCHSVLNMLTASRSAASAALHSTDLDASDSEDELHACEGTFRNISFLNLGTPNASQSARLTRSASEQPSCEQTEGRFGFDEDLQSMPLLHSDPAPLGLPVSTPAEAATVPLAKSTDAATPMDVNAGAVAARVLPIMHHSSCESPPVNLQLRLTGQKNQEGMYMHRPDSAESLISPHLSIIWSVNEAVSSIGCGLEDLSLYSMS